jgi:hypothetical protein|tara:strand:- start:87 stop:1559 length:1473 start_codon:yes stop_codon:yes gene_type:complete
MAKASSETISEAGDFKVDAVSITTSTGLVVDLLGSVMHITFFESIENAFVTGNILITDHVNLVTIGPIIGQEFIKLKLRTPGMSGENGVIDFTENVFVVTSMKARQNIGNGQQGILLEFASAEMLKNERTKLNSSFEGTCSELFKKIIRSNLDCTKELFVEPSDGIKKLVFPNVRPIHAIHMLKRQAVSQVSILSSPYMFYEDLKGVHFRSLSSMYAAVPVMKYTTSIPGSKPANVFEDLRTVINHQITGNGDTLLSQRLGAYGSNLTIYDTFAKKQTRQGFSYLDTFHKIPHANTLSGGRPGKSFPLVNSSPIEPTGTISDFPAKSFLVPTARFHNDGVDQGTINYQETGSGRYTFVGGDTKKWLQLRESALTHLEFGISANLEVHGNTLVNAGDLIEFNLPTQTAAKTEKNEKYDFFFNGEFLIKKIRHDFDFGQMRHEMVLSVVRDDLAVELDEVAESHEYENKPTPPTLDTEDFYSHLNDSGSTVR